MPNGPCLCGDPCCPSCGNPEAARIEAAEEWAIDQLHAELLTEHEYRLAVEVGIAAVRAHRQVVQKLDEERAAAQAEARAAMMKEPHTWPTLRQLAGEE